MSVIRMLVDVDIREPRPEQNIVKEGTVIDFGDSKNHWMVDRGYAEWFDGRTAPREKPIEAAVVEPSEEQTVVKRGRGRPRKLSHA